MKIVGRRTLDVGRVAATLIACCIAFATSVQAALQIDNAAVTNAGRTSAELRCNLVSVSTNSTNATITVFYGRTDAGTNISSWASSNVYGSVSTGYYATNITGLLPASWYYYRWYAIEDTNTTDWADSTTNVWTSAGVPTNTPATDSHAVIVDTNGNLLSPTNLWDQNGVAKTNVTDALLSTQAQQQATQDALVSTQALQQTSIDGLLTTQDVQQTSIDGLLSTQDLQQTTQDALVSTQANQQATQDALVSTQALQQTSIDGLLTTQDVQQTSIDGLLTTQDLQQTTQDALLSTQSLQQATQDALVSTQATQQATQDALESTQATHTAEISGLLSTQLQQIAVSPEYLAYTNAGGSGTGGTVIATSDLLTNGYASSDYDTSGGMTPWSADVEISFDGVSYSNAYETTNDCYARFVVGDGADDTAVITNITVYSWSRPDLYGEVRDTRGQDVRVDSPDTDRSAANKDYVDAQVAANVPSDWSEYEATETVFMDGHAIYLGDSWNISQTGGVGVISYGDVWATTNEMVIAHNGWPMIRLTSGLGGLCITNFDIGETTGTLWVATNGVISEPLPQWTDSIDHPEWATFGSYTSSYPTVTNSAYRIDFTLPAGDTIYLRAVQQTGDGSIALLADVKAGSAGTKNVLTPDGLEDISDSLDNADTALQPADTNGVVLASSATAGDIMVYTGSEWATGRVEVAAGSGGISVGVATNNGTVTWTISDDVLAYTDIYDAGYAPTVTVSMADGEWQRVECTNAVAIDLDGWPTGSGTGCWARITLAPGTNVPTWVDTTIWPDGEPEPPCGVLLEYDSYITNVWRGFMQ